MTSGSISTVCALYSKGEYSKGEDELAIKAATLPVGHACLLDEADCHVLCVFGVSAVG
jgi:hypothetical protein